MKRIRIIAAMMVFVGMALISACGEEKTTSLEGHEDIVAVLQKIPQCYDNPKTAMEIYADDAILMRQDPATGQMLKLTGPKEIGEYRGERGKNYGEVRVSISSIEEEADKAHVEYSIIVQLGRGEPVDYSLSCSAEMVKKGQTWKIKKEITKAH